MREYVVSSLILLYTSAACAQTATAGWKVVRDSKSLCQIMVPPDWALMDQNSGAAVFHDAATAIAVVTAQPGQAFKPLTAPLLKVMDIPKERMFENSAKRIFYQDKVSRNSEDQNAFSASVPGNGATCSCHVVVVPGVSEQTAKTIVLSLGPAPEKDKT